MADLKLRGIEKTVYQRELEQKAYQAFVPECEQEAVDMTEFFNVYSSDEIRRDSEYVAGKEKQFLQTRPILEIKSKILEAIVFKQAELYNWFGDNAFTIKTSRYDDIANGVDLVIEMTDKNDASYLAIAVDLTVVQDTQAGSLAEKLTAIKEGLEKNKLGTVKYFKSFAENGVKKKLENVPRLILATDLRTLNELMEFSLNKNHSKLKGHPIQRQFLEELKIQLAEFKNFTSAETAAKFKDLEILIKNLLETRQNLSTDFRHQDIAFVNMAGILKSFALAKKTAGV